MIKSKNWGIGVLILLVFILMSVLNYFNIGSPGRADSYMHYLFAKWAFIHPHLLFDHWGKPVFTILSAPFAQFGFKGVVTFNIITAIFSGFLVYKSAQKMGVQNAWVGILFTIFTPIFFLISFSSLTEIIFAFFVTLSLYLFIDKQFFWSVIVMSFVPFARTEGIIFFPIMLIALVALKEYKYTPLLMVGFVIMSIAGYPVYHDLLWPITKNPYHDSSALYGNGELLHFVKESPKLFGWPLLVMFGLGIIASIVIVWKNKLNHVSVVLFLLLSVSLGYFAAHSVVWAYGMGASAGLIRVMAGVAPVIAMVGLFGFDFLVQKVFKNPKVKTGLFVLVGVVMVIEGTTKPNLPLKHGQEETVLEQVCEFVVHENLRANYIVYFNPVVAYMLDLDHFTTKNSQERVVDNTHPSNNLPLGAIVIWDSHFGPNEGGLPKLRLDNNSAFEKRKTFGAQDYEVIIYQKTQDLNN